MGHLLTPISPLLTFRTEWQISIKVPLLSVALDWESRIWQSQGRQHKQTAGEIRSYKSDASLKFIQYELEKQDKEIQIAEDNGEVDGKCELRGCVREPQGRSQHHTNSDRGPDLGISRKADLNDACSGSDHTPVENLKERLNYENHPDSTKTNLVEKSSKEAADAGLGEAVSNDATQEIRQKITSSVFSFSSNMTTFGECVQDLYNQN